MEKFSALGLTIHIAFWLFLILAIIAGLLYFEMSIAEPIRAGIRSYALCTPIVIVAVVQAAFSLLASWIIVETVSLYRRVKPRRVGMYFPWVGVGGLAFLVVSMTGFLIMRSGYSACA